VAEIKTALKEFLKQEMQWKQPDDKDTPASTQKAVGIGKS
jgi:hypothetical protein